MAKTRRKPRRFPETQIRLRQILDELRELKALINERLPPDHEPDLIADMVRRFGGGRG